MIMSIIKHLIKRLPIIYFSVFLSLILTGQETDNPLFPKTHPSPGSMSIQEGVSTQEGLFTGTYHISYPIWTIEATDFSIPITLDYTTSARKVAEFSGEVGLGWSLNAGGVITRVVNGFKDEDPLHGYFNNDIPLQDNPSPLSYYEAMTGAEDNEPDVFTYNVNGYSGKFVIAQDQGQIIQIPESNIDIDYEIAGTDIDYFVLTTPDGVKYTFDVQEKIELTTNQSTTPRTSVTAWYPSEIELPNTIDKILIGYGNLVNYEITYPEKQSKIYKVDGETSQCAPAWEFKETISTAKYLLKPYVTNINYEYKNQSVFFDYVADLNYNTNARRLTGIRITSMGNWLYYRLDHEITQYHHFLTEIVKHDNLTNGKENITTFEYYGTNLPDQTSNGIDFWGYYNGVETNASKIPLLEYNGITYGNAYKYSTEAAKRGLLKRIIYPTGGFKEFQYELHDWSEIDKSGYTVSDPQNNTQYWKVIYRDSELTNFLIKHDQLVYFDIFIDGVDHTLLEARIEPVDVDDPRAQTHTYTESVNQEPIFLYEGLWKIWLKERGFQDEEQWGNSYIRFHIDYSGDGGIDELRSRGAGVRIKKVLNYDGKKLDSTRFEYTKERVGEGDPISSGVLLSGLTLLTTFNRNCYEYLPQQRVTSGYIELHSDNYYGDHQFRGSNVAYSRVIEYVGGKNDETGLNGKIVYEYELDGGYRSSNIYPHNPLKDNDGWKYGQIKKKTTYDTDDDVVLTEENNYTLNTYSTEVWGISANFKTIDSWAMDEAPDPTNNQPMPPGYESEYEWDNWNGVWVQGGPYCYQTGYKHLVSKTVEHNAPPINTKEKTQYLYNQNHLVTHNITRLVDDEDPFTLNDRLHVMRSIYPDEYTGNTMATALLNKHILNRPIEEISFMIDNAGYFGNLTLSNVIDWKVNIFNIIDPHILNETYDVDLQRLIVNNPSFDIDDFGSSRIGTLTSNADQMFNVVVHNSYGNRYEVDERGRSKMSYVYNYKVHEKPIAIAANATRSQIYYTSFEEPDLDYIITGGAKTGDRYCSNGLQKTLPNLPYGQYIKSYWAKEGGNWVFHKSVEDHTSGTYTLTLTGNVDEVRLYPVDAQMVTYTYKPLFGLSSITDEKDVTTSFVYDSLGRLSRVLDNDGNILKEYEYHYKGEE